MTVLEARGVTKRFGGLTAVDSVDLELRSGTIASVIGPNGAGKTTFFNLITGIYEPSGGSFALEGRDLRRHLGRRDLLLAAVIAVGTALYALSLTRGVPAFEAFVREYVFRQPFDFAAAFGRTLASLAERPLAALLSLLAGGALGAGGFWSIWSASRVRPHLVSRRGVGRTFQNIRLFGDMTVVENVLVGMGPHLRSRLWDVLLRTPRFRREEARARREAMALLETVGLRGRARDLARNLPYGDRRKLEIARALALKPRLLLLDEPTAGMNPQETLDLTRLIRELRERFDLTVLLIEHHMRVVMGISERVTVLDHGARIAEGPPEAIQRDPKVIEAYLGRAPEAH